MVWPHCANSVLFSHVIVMITGIVKGEVFVNNMAT